MWRCVLSRVSFLFFTLTSLPCLAADAEIGLKATLSSQYSRYVLGQPVLLVTTIQNTGAEPVVLPEPILIFEQDPFDILISDDAGRSFRLYSHGFGVTLCPIGLPETTLEPTEKLHLPMRVLYDIQSPNRLAFRHAGKYFLKSACTIKTKEMNESLTLQSNTIQLVIDEPHQESDRKTWAVLNNNEMLFFLQFGFPRRRSEIIPRQAVDILLKSTHSSYHSGIRFALGKHYFRHMSNDDYVQENDTEILRRIRSAIGYTTNRTPIRNSRR